MVFIVTGIEGGYGQQYRYSTKQHYHFPSLQSSSFSDNLQLSNAKQPRGPIDETYISIGFPIEDYMLNLHEQGIRYIMIVKLLLNHFGQPCKSCNTNYRRCHANAAHIYRAIPRCTSITSHHCTPQPGDRLICWMTASITLVVSCIVVIIIFNVNLLIAQQLVFSACAYMFVLSTSSFIIILINSYFKNKYCLFFRSVFSYDYLFIRIANPSIASCPPGAGPLKLSRV